MTKLSNYECGFIVVNGVRIRIYHIRSLYMSGHDIEKAFNVRIGRRHFDFVKVGNIRRSLLKADSIRSKILSPRLMSEFNREFNDFVLDYNKKLKSGLNSGMPKRYRVYLGTNCLFHIEIRSEKGLRLSNKYLNGLTEMGLTLKE